MRVLSGSASEKSPAIVDVKAEDPDGNLESVTLFIMDNTTREIVWSESREMEGGKAEQNHKCGPGLSGPAPIHSALSKDRHQVPAWPRLWLDQSPDGKTFLFAWTLRIVSRSALRIWREGMHFGGL
jgi:hypothetical protein